MYFGMYTHGSSLIACYFYLMSPLFVEPNREETETENTTIRFDCNGLPSNFIFPSLFFALVNFGKINVWAMARKRKKKNRLDKTFRRRLSFARSSKVHAVTWMGDAVLTLIRWIFVFIKFVALPLPLFIPPEIVTGFVTLPPKLLNGIPFRPNGKRLNRFGWCGTNFIPFSPIHFCLFFNNIFFFLPRMENIKLVCTRRAEKLCRTHYGFVWWKCLRKDDCKEKQIVFTNASEKEDPFTPKCAAHPSFGLDGESLLTVRIRIQRSK